MAAPTLSDYQQSTWTDQTAGNEVTPTVTWSAGDLIVVLGATEDNAGVQLDVPTATGLTFTQLIATNTVSNTKCYVWTATAGSSGSGAITANRLDGGTKARGIAAFVYSGSDGTGNTGTIVDSAAFVVSLVRASANSAVLVVLGDWNAVNDTAVTSEPVAGATQRVAAFATGATFFVLNWTDQGNAGTTSYGFTDAGHGTVLMAGIAVEIKGTAAAPRRFLLVR
jgi:hypothetical protein